MSLQSIRQEIISHPSNNWARKKGYKPVYMASEQSKVIIIGQAPGRKAQESGTPWNDVSGDTLRQWLSLTREDFYNPQLFALIPMDFYFPGKDKHGDKPPRREFAAMWHPKLFEYMPHAQLILLVGQYAQKYYLGKAAKRNLTETVRSYAEYLPTYFPLVHPSPLNSRWQSRNPWFKQEVVTEANRLVHNCIS